MSSALTRLRARVEALENEVAAQATLLDWYRQRFAAFSAEMREIAQEGPPPAVAPATSLRGPEGPLGRLRVPLPPGAAPVALGTLASLMLVAVRAHDARGATPGEIAAAIHRKPGTGRWKAAVRELRAIGAVEGHEGRLIAVEALREVARR